MAARRCVNARPHKDDDESDEAWGSEVPTSLSCLVDKLRECLRVWGKKDCHAQLRTWVWRC